MIAKKKWYVVHVYSGSEKRVKESIEEQSNSKNMTEFIEEVMVPTEELFEIRKGSKVKTEKKFFPGYILVKMEMTDESWHFIKSQPKVTNFLGPMLVASFTLYFESQRAGMASILIFLIIGLILLRKTKI